MNGPVVGRHLFAAGTLGHWPEVNRLLDDALDLAQDQRGEWFASLPDSPAKAVLAPLLAQLAHVESSEFLCTLPPLSQNALARIKRERTAGAPEAGDEVGPWRLLRKLGQGGMGAVWLAERSDGQLKRPVALKLPHAAWSCLSERLARERDILATLEHPHIARLYDAGVDDRGRPWLAIEYVDGRPIDEHVRREGLGLPAMLGLLLQVAQAVQYAHERHIVHRDLKPSNILVSADGHVRLLDFGIAKLLPEAQAAETGLTQRVGHALTPDYASPEQLRGEPVGTASDIYSLSVVAYGLLAGVPPYRFHRRSAAALEEAIEHIDAPLASRVALDPARARLLRGDIDAVLNCGLKKLPAERYASVAAWADDLRALLENRAVQARPDSPAYLTARFLRRHRTAAAAAAAVAVAFALAIGIGTTTLMIAVLTLGLAAAMWQAREARRGRDAAEAATRLAQHAGTRAETAAAAERAAAEQARRDAAHAGAIGEFMFDVFRANATDQPDPDAALKITARELLQRGVARVEDLREEHPQAHAQLLHMFGTLYDKLGQYSVAQPLLERGLAAAVQAFGPEHEQTQRAQLALAWRLHESEQYGRAVELIDRAMQSLDVAGRKDGLMQYALALEADMFWNRDAPRAARAGEEALALMKRLPPSGTDTEARAMHALGLARYHLGQLEQAAADIRGARVLLEARLGHDHPACGQAWCSLGEMLAASMDLPGAFEAFAQAIRIASLYPRLASEDLASAHLGRVRLYHATGDLEQAVAELETVACLRLSGKETRGHLGYQLELHHYRSQLAWHRGDMAEVLNQAGAALALTSKRQMPVCMVLRVVMLKARAELGEWAPVNPQLAAQLASEPAPFGSRPFADYLNWAAARAAAHGQPEEADRLLDQAARTLAPILHLPGARLKRDTGRAHVAAQLGRHDQVELLAEQWLQWLVPPDTRAPRLPQAHLALKLCNALPPADARRKALLAPTLDWLRREQSPASPWLAQAQILANTSGRG